LTVAGIELRSPSFGDHQPIPARHAKDHDDLSPALEWSGVPEEAAELAVLCQDPDAPGGIFTHWVLAGLEPTVTGLAEGERPAAAVEGHRDFGEEGSSGPFRRSVTVLTDTSSGYAPPRRRWDCPPVPRPRICAVPWRARSSPAAPSSAPTSAEHSPVYSWRLDCQNRGQS
jgi:phosphatidylethanolamine-binding protein (PEBP) family uncharacterized protein